MAPATTSRWQTLYRRLLALVLRPTAPPLWLGVLVAAGFIAAELALVLLLKRVAPENAFGAVFLLGVLVVSAGWGFGLAVATSLASAAVYVYIHWDDSARRLTVATVIQRAGALRAAAWPYLTCPPDASVRPVGRGR